MDADIESGLKWIARGGSFMIVGTFAGKAITYLYRIFVARYLGTADYGLLSLSLSVFYISMTFATLSMDSGVKRYVSRYIGENSPERVKGTIISGLQLTIPVSLLVAVLLFLLAPVIATHGFKNPELAFFIRIFAIAVPFQALYNVFSSVVAAYKRVEYQAIVDEVYQSAATLVVTVVLVLAGYGLMGAVIGQIVALVTASLLIVYFTEKKVFPFLAQQADGFRNHSQIYSYSLPLLFSGIIGQITGWTDTVMLGFFDTASSVGVYNAALPTARIIGVFGAFGGLLFPVVSEMYAEGKKQRSITVTETTVKWIFSFTFPFFVIMVLFSSPLLKLLFGNAYLTGSIALSVLAVAFFTNTILGYSSTFIGAEERTKLSMYNSIVAAGLNVVLNLLLIPYFIEHGVGSTGAGIATATSMAAGGVLATLEVYYLFGVQPLRLRKLFPPAAAVVAAAGIVYAVIEAVFDVTPVWVLVPAFITFGVLYGVFFLLFGGLEEEDIMVLKAVEDKTGHNFDRARAVVRRLAR
ncbi:MAG: flippase [Candidatus Nanohaloarchaea archaeon]|nr:flippase [Candidatus Nanohaloarchaea archaeon]